MELVEGRSLRTYLGDETVPMEQRIGWLRDVAHALEAAHEVKKASAHYLGYFVRAEIAKATK